MKQVLQNARTGSLELVEVPAPAPEVGEVLVRNRFSVVSPGTEKMAMDFARQSLLGKARSRPDLVRQVTRKLVQEGPGPTFRTVTNRLEAPQPLGYSCAGTVEAVGSGVTRFRPGDAVACAGAGYANHAELVSVPENLVATVPAGLNLEKAAFATLGAIAMQGLRVGEPQIGERVAVIGLGLIGQLTVQLLRANGCRVYGIDLDPRRITQAREQGAVWSASPGDDHEGWRTAEAAGHGADLVIVTAASESSAPLQLAAELSRHKGRVVAVGATAMDLDRRSFYEKELELRMSMSYGPGRYDRRYEEMGLDYPLPYVRWTENRNLEAFLELAAAGQIDPGALDTRTIEFGDAVEAYEALARGEHGGLALLFRYVEDVETARSLRLRSKSPARTADGLGVAFLGAGNYAKAVLLPALAGCQDVRREALVTATGASALRTAERFDFASCGTDPAEVLARDDVDLVFIATRHDSHATLTCQVLRAGKAVWVEKPLALNAEELEAVAEAVRETGGFLAVGYNRRFSSHARAMKQALAGRPGPLALQYTVAAGATPTGTWLTDPKVGGGRIVGEVCHFVDLASFLVGAGPTHAQGTPLSRDPETDDASVLQLGFPDRSVATIHYLTGADPSLPKERFEVSAGGQTWRCENFRTTGPVTARRPAVRGLNQDKGQAAAVEEVVRRVRNGEPSPFELEELLAVSRATFEVAGIASRVLGKERT